MGAALIDSVALRVAFGQLVRAERERRGWSRAAVAERAGVRVRELHDIEDGRADLDIFAYDRLARLGLRRSLAALVVAAEKQVAAGGSADVAERREVARAGRSPG